MLPHGDDVHIRMTSENLPHDDDVLSRCQVKFHYDGDILTNINVLEATNNM